MVAVKTGFTPPPMPGMPAPMQPMGGLPPMGGPGSFPQPMGGGNPFAPLPPMPLAGSPPPMQPPMGGPGTFPVAPNRQVPQQQGSNAPRRKRFGDSLEGMLGRNQGLGATAPQQRPPQMMPQQQQRMVAPGTPMMRTPPMDRGMPRPMQMGGEVDIFGYEDGGPVQYMNDGGLAILTLPDGNAYIDFGGGAYHHVSPNEPGQDVVASLQSAYGDRIGEVRAADQGEQDYIFAKVDYGKGQNLTDDTTVIDDTTVTTNTGVNNSNTAVVDNSGVADTSSYVDTSAQSAATSAPASFENAALFGPVVRDTPSYSQFVQNPTTGAITTTGGNTMTAVSPIGSIDLPAAPVDIDIYDYLADPVFGSMSPVIRKEMGGAVPMQTNIAGQPHGLAYINQDEEALLRSFGGSGIAGPGGIPSYPPSEYSAGQGSGYTTGTGSSNFDSGYISSAKKRRKKKRQQKLAAERAAAEQAIRDAEAAAQAVPAQQNNPNIAGPMESALQNFGGTAFQSAASSPAAPEVFGGIDATPPGFGAAPPPPVNTGMSEGLGIVNQMQNAANLQAALGAGIDATPPGFGATSIPEVFVPEVNPASGFASNFMNIEKPDRILDREAALFPDLRDDDPAFTQNIIPSEVVPENPFSYDIGAIGFGDNRDDTQANLGSDVDVDQSGVGLPSGLASPEGRDDTFVESLFPTSRTPPIFPPSDRGFEPSGTQIAPEAATVTPTENFESTRAMLESNVFDPSGGAKETDPNQFPVEKIQSMFPPKTGTGGSNKDGKSGKLTPEELEKLKASLGEQVPISGVEKVINQVIGGAFFGLGSGFADKLKNSSEAERQAIVDQHLNALNSGATPVYNDKGEYVGFNMNTMDTFADKVLGADDISVFLPGGSADADGDGVTDYDRFQQVFDAQSTAADADKFGQSTEQGFITSDGREFFVDATGNVVEVTDGVVPFEIGGGDSAVDIFNIASGSDDGGDDGDDDTTDGSGGGYTVDEDGNIVCNKEGYIYNPETKKCEPEEEKEEEKDLSINVVRGEDFDDVLGRVTTAAPNIGSISGNVQNMQEGGMAGLNRAADNFLQALAG